jgi:hypothetical protein
MGASALFAVAGAAEPAPVTRSTSFSSRKLRSSSSVGFGCSCKAMSKLLLTSVEEAFALGPRVCSSWSMGALSRQKHIYRMHTFVNETARDTPKKKDHLMSA